MATNTSNGVAFGYKSDNMVILAPGQTYDYTDTRTGTSNAQQHAWASYMLPTGEWYGVGDAIDFRSYLTPAKTEISQPMNTTPQYPIVNQQTNVRFKVKNTGDQPIRYDNIGVAVTRTSDGSRFDYTSQPNTVVNGNSEFTYTASRTLPTKDVYSFVITGSLDGLTWGSSYVGTESSAALKIATVNTYNTPANIQVITPMSSMTKKQGELVTLTYTVRNTGDQPTGNISLAFYCRVYGQYCDIPGDTVNLGFNEEHTVTRICFIYQRW